VTVILRLATFADIAPFTREPLGYGQAARDTTARLALAYEIASFDGKDMRLDTADRITADPQAHAAILVKRNALVERGRAAGVAWATCPHCKAAEVRLGLIGYATRIGALPPEPVAADPAFLLPPSLSLDHAPGRLPAAAATAAKIRFELPSAAIGMGRVALPAAGQLGTIDPKREAAAWQRWATDQSNWRDDRVWWTRDNACFRAALALSVGIERLDPGGRPTPEKIARMPVIDVYFLDALYFLTHFADVPEHAIADTCPSCQGQFFPVLRNA
jgi:hypothetical protein